MVLWYVWGGTGQVEVKEPWELLLNNKKKSDSWPLFLKQCEQGASCQLYCLMPARYFFNKPVVSHKHCAASAKQRRSTHFLTYIASEIPQGWLQFPTYYQHHTVPAYLGRVCVHGKPIRENFKQPVCTMTGVAWMSFKGEYCMKRAAWHWDTHTIRGLRASIIPAEAVRKKLGWWPAGRCWTSQRKMSLNAGQPVVILTQLPVQLASR